MMSKSIHLLYAIVCLLFLGLQTACVSDDHEAGQGILQIQVGVNEDVIIETKAGTTTQLDSCKVLIKNDKGDIIRKYENAATMPTEEWLIAGRYIVEASLGTPKKAEFDHPCYVGEASVDVIANKSVSKEVVCKLSQSKVSVVYEKGITSNFKDYATDVVMGTSKLTFKKDSVKIGYYYNGTEEKQNLVCTITATPNSGSAVKKEFTIENIKPCTHYVIHADYNTELAEGGFKFEIEVNELTDDKNDDVTVPITKYPVIQIVDMTPDGKFIFGQLPAGSEPGLITCLIKGYPALSSVLIGGSYLKDILGLPSSIDLLGLEESAKSELINKGWTFTKSVDQNEPLKHELMTIKMPVPLTVLFNDKILNIEVTDIKNQNRKKNNLKVEVTDLHVSTSETIDYETWSTWSVLRGTRNPGAVITETIRFEYRKMDTETWNEINSEISGDNYYTVVTGLTPGTTYQYRIKEGDKTGKIETFTTEGQLQLPNNSFEFWHRGGEGNKVDLIYEEGGTMFWDSGNHGSATMSINVTTKDDKLHQAGLYAIKLQSQFVGVFGIGKFAAGNLFAGKYLKTDGTDGVLSFGRPFGSRPGKLTFYYKYTSEKVDKYSKDPELPKGSNDKAQIYIAIGDWESETFEGYQAPVLIKTKDKKLFDPNSKSVIAYGQLTVDNSTSGDALIKGEVELTYYSSRKPKYIVIVATASKYGDYFAGGEGSTLWLDDMTLEYPTQIPEISNK